MIAMMEAIMTAMVLTAFFKMHSVYTNLINLKIEKRICLVSSFGKGIAEGRATYN